MISQSELQRLEDVMYEIESKKASQAADHAAQAVSRANETIDVIRRAMACDGCGDLLRHVAQQEMTARQLLYHALVGAERALEVATSVAKHEAKG
jgi:hypothetical protein